MSEKPYIITFTFSLVIAAGIFNFYGEKARNSYGLVKGAKERTISQAELKLEIIKEEAKQKQQLADTINYWLSLALTTDTLEKYVVEPFHFFKSGYLLNKKIKSAVYVKQVSDTNEIVYLYNLEGDVWQLKDSLTNMDAVRLAFFLKFDDYDFDGLNDIFVNRDCSNGYAMHFGSLVLVNPRTYKLNLHHELNQWGNLSVDKLRKEITYEDIVRYKEPETIVEIKRHKWSNGKLINIGSRKKIWDF
ncbi:MAG TPA: hypothetical protein VK177_02960 [Flavobacteriales bacterium]|nr:hypothetical protein [Flavobacteriales bacterium]